MISRNPINANRIRRITGSFSWIDHRLLSDGFLSVMAGEEILLYFFLTLVGDKNGVSFYSYDKICHFLKMDVDRFVQARNQLIDKSLIACENGRFQVLQLPKTVKNPIIVQQPIPRIQQTKSLADIFKQLAQQPNWSPQHERERLVANGSQKSDAETVTLDLLPKFE